MSEKRTFTIQESEGNIPEGLVAVVTGAGSGVGRAVAIELAKRGVKVGLVGRRRGKLEMVEKTIVEGGGSCGSFAADVSNIDEVDGLKKQISSALGSPAILVNAAGIHCELVPIRETTPEKWKNTIDINLFGCYLTCRAFMGEMISNGWGRIINVTSASSLHPPGHIGAVYPLSKVALNHFTRQLASELKETGVTANVIHPGEVKTEMWAKIKEDASSRDGEGKGALRWVRTVERTGGDPPEATAEAVLTLLRCETSAPNGQFLWIRDGMKEPMPSW